MATREEKLKALEDLFGPQPEPPKEESIDDQIKKIVRDEPLYQDNFAGYTAPPVPEERDNYNEIQSQLTRVNPGYPATGLNRLTPEEQARLSVGADAPPLTPVPYTAPAQLPPTNPNSPIDPNLLAMQLEQIKKRRQDAPLYEGNYAGYTAQPPTSQVANPNQNFINPPAPAPAPLSDREIFDAASTGSIPSVSEAVPVPKAPVKSRDEMIREKLAAAREARSQDAALTQGFQGLDILSRGIAGAKPSDPRLFKQDAALQDNVNKYSKLLEKYQDSKTSTAKAQQTQFVTKDGNTPVSFKDGQYFFVDKDGKKKAVGAKNIKQVTKRTGPIEEERLSLAKKQFGRLKDKQIDILVSYDNTLDSLDAAQAIVDAGTKPGPVKDVLDRYARYLPGNWQNAKRSELRALTSNALSQYVKSLSGAQVSDKERADLEAVVPLAKDTEVEFTAKMKNMRSLLKTFRANKVKGYAKYGQYNVKEFENSPRWRDIKGYGSESGKPVPEGKIRVRHKKSGKIGLIPRDKLNDNYEAI